jgi:signal transduction histidine kinase
VSSPTSHADSGNYENAASAQANPVVEDTIWQILQASADDVSREATSADAALDGSGELAEHCVAVLRVAISHVASGSRPELSTIPAYAPTRRLLVFLRKRFLERVAGAPCGTVSTRALLDVVRAMEDVGAIIEMDPAHRFGEKLDGARAAELLVAVAHDMRSPLASILFLVDTLRRSDSGPVTEAQVRQLLLVYSAAFGLSTLTNDLIDLVRGGGEQLLNGSSIPFSVQECLYAVRDIVQPIAEEKKLSVEIAPSRVDYRSGHPAALTRVLLNLTTNALKFTHSGSVRVSAAEVSRTRVEFSVRDTGRGIPAEVVETLFDAVRPRGQGGQFIFSSAGLGLSICQKLVAQLGGALQVESKPSVGTRFSFQIELPPVQRI